MKSNERTPEQHWQEHWRNILELPDGSINVEQLKLELADFSDMIERMTKLTCYLTHERLSYPTYPVTTLIQVHEECMEDEQEDNREEDKEYGECRLCGREFEEKS